MDKLIEECRAKNLAEKDLLISYLWRHVIERQEAIWDDLDDVDVWWDAAPEILNRIDECIKVEQCFKNMTE